MAANLATVHIPGLLSWRPFAYFRGASFHDGSLHKSALDFEQSQLKPRCKRVFVMDMGEDPELQVRPRTTHDLSSRPLFGSLEVIGILNATAHLMGVQLSWWSMGGMKNYEEVMRLFDRGYSHASQLQSDGKLDMFSTSSE